MSTAAATATARIAEFDSSFHTSTILHPLDDRVVIRKDAPPEESHGGILIPESARRDTSAPVTGTVIAVGPGRLCEAGGRLPMALKRGDEVILGKYAGTELDVEGDRLTVVKESEVLAVIETRGDA